MHWDPKGKSPRLRGSLFRRHQEHIDWDFEADVKKLENPDDYSPELDMTPEKATTVSARISVEHFAESHAFFLNTMRESFPLGSE